MLWTFLLTVWLFSLLALFLFSPFSPSLALVFPFCLAFWTFSFSVNKNTQLLFTYNFEQCCIKSINICTSGGGESESEGAGMGGGGGFLDFFRGCSSTPSSELLLLSLSLSFLLFSLSFFLFSSSSLSLSRNRRSSSASSFFLRSSSSRLRSSSLFFHSLIRSGSLSL